MATSPVESPLNSDLLDLLLTTATCRCGRKIKPGEYRIVVVAAELGMVPPAIDPTAIGGRRRLLTFCAPCSFGVKKRDDIDGSPEEVFGPQIVRMLFGSTARQLSQDVMLEERFLREWAEEARFADTERETREKALTAAVRRGDGQVIDQMLPVHPVKEDLLAHGLGGQIYQADVPRATVSKDGPQLMAEYLRSTKSNTLKPFQRRVAQLWSAGKNQTEIANELAREFPNSSSQPTVCRVIKILKAIIHVG
jgi:hypothetical protein